MMVEIARAEMVEEGAHILDLSQSACPSRRFLADLLLALVGWGTADLVAEMGADAYVADHRD